MTDGAHLITFDLDHGETWPLLINSLRAYSDLLLQQADQQDGFGHGEYAHSLRDVAAEAREMVAAIEHVKPAP